MVNIDKNFPAADAGNHFAKTFNTRAIGGNDAVKFHAGARFLEQAILVEKAIFVGNGVLIPANHFFTLILQRQGQAEL